MANYLQKVSPLPNFPAYRKFQRQLDEVNSAVMGMLVGAGLASNTLSLNSGSKVSVQKIYPELPHAHRFDLRPDQARGILDRVEPHLANMAIPYVLATLEEFVSYLLPQLDHRTWQDESGLSQSQLIEGLCRNEHPRLSHLSLGLLHVYEYARKGRNLIIHDAGRVNQYYADFWLEKDAEAAASWRRWRRGNLPTPQVGEVLAFSQSDIAAHFAAIRAVGSRLAQAAPALLSPESWFLVVAEDVKGASISGNRAQIQRRLRGYLRTNYPDPGWYDFDRLCQEI